MVNDVGFDTIEGQKLELCEQQVQAAACNLLSEYFKGKMKPDLIEREFLDNKYREVYEEEDYEGPSSPHSNQTLFST